MSIRTNQVTVTVLETLRGPDVETLSVRECIAVHCAHLPEPGTTVLLHLYPYPGFPGEFLIADEPGGVVERAEPEGCPPVARISRDRWFDHYPNPDWRPVPPAPGAPICTGFPWEELVEDVRRANPAPKP